MKRILILSIASAVGLLTQSAEAKVPGGPWRWLSLGWGDGYHAPPCPDRDPWHFHHHRHHPHHHGMHLPMGHFEPGYPAIHPPYAPAPHLPAAHPLHAPPTSENLVPPPPESPWPDASARLPR